MAEPDFLHDLASELAALSQNALTYPGNHYEVARGERIRDLAAELFGRLAGLDATTVREGFAVEAGHATPKVDVRGAVFDADDRVLLVQEGRDGLWTLPGGWADALDAPSHACLREVREEAGLDVTVTRLAAVHDGSVHNGHGGTPWHIYKLLFLCERVDPAQAPVAGLDGETLDVGWFDVDEPPPLSLGRTSVEQLVSLRNHHRDTSLATEFD